MTNVEAAKMKYIVARLKAEKMKLKT